MGGEEHRPRKFSFQELKRCVLAFLKPGADFSSRCAHQAPRPPISATHPYYDSHFANGLFASSLSTHFGE
jgi:hypothetical protein